MTKAVSSVNDQIRIPVSEKRTEEKETSESFFDVLSGEISGTQSELGPDEMKADQYAGNNVKDKKDDGEIASEYKKEAQAAKEKISAGQNDGSEKIDKNPKAETSAKQKSVEQKTSCKATDLESDDNSIIKENGKGTVNSKVSVDNKSAQENNRDNKPSLAVKLNNKTNTATQVKTAEPVQGKESPQTIPEDSAVNVQNVSKRSDGTVRAPEKSRIALDVNSSGGTKKHQVQSKEDQAEISAIKKESPAGSGSSNSRVDNKVVKAKSKQHENLQSAVKDKPLDIVENKNVANKSSFQTSLNNNSVVKPVEPNRNDEQPVFLQTVKYESNQQVKENSVFDINGDNVNLSSHIETAESPVISIMNNLNNDNQRYVDFESPRVNINEKEINPEPATVKKVTETAVKNDFYQNTSNELHNNTRSASLSQTPRSVPAYFKNSGEMFRNIAGQIVKNAKITYQNGQTEMKMALDPPELGEIKIKLVMENKSIVAKVEVENQAVRDVLQSNISSLRDAMNSEGLKLDGFDISFGKEFSKGFAFENENSKNNQNRMFFENEDEIDSETRTKTKNVRKKMQQGKKIDLVV